MAASMLILLFSSAFFDFIDLFSGNPPPDTASVRAPRTHPSVQSVVKLETGLGIFWLIQLSILYLPAEPG